MKMRTRLTLATAAIAMTMTAVTPAIASSHRESPNLTELRKVDGTDFYMFRSYEPGRAGFVTFIANYQPLQGPGDGPNYFTMDPDAIYEIHIDNDGDAVENLTFQFKFANALRNNTGVTVNVGGKTLPIALRHGGPIADANSATQGETESYTLTAITGDRRTGTRAAVTNASGGATSFAKPFDNAGTKTFPNYAAYANQFVYSVNIPGCTTAGRVFVGQRAEAFAINFSSFDLINYIPVDGDSQPGNGDGRGFPGGIRQNRANDDLIGKMNITSLAIEVPTSCVTGTGNGTIGAWTTASLPQAVLRDPTPTYAAPAIQGGAYVQVSRLGQPLVNELVIGLPQKDLFNAAKPAGDAALIDYVTNPTFPAVLDALFGGAVNGVLGRPAGSTIAPNNFPRNDLVTTFLTGIPTLNQMARVTASEMLRLNTGVAATPRATQSTFGVVGDDLAGYPNGRRPGDDVTDITLRVAMGRLCHPVPIMGRATPLGLCTPENAPTGTAAFTDGAPESARDFQDVFPYLNTPLSGAPSHNARTGS